MTFPFFLLPFMGFGRVREVRTPIPWKEPVDVPSLQGLDMEKIVEQSKLAAQGRSVSEGVAYSAAAVFMEIRRQEAEKQ